MRAGRRINVQAGLAEGDGWVDWSGLATLLADLGYEVVTLMKRLPIPSHGES
jgi:hypothetical protein